MIFVRDKGQMCNNILQYAHMYAWGREHGIKTMSMRFAYKYQYFHISHTRYHCFLLYVLVKMMGAIGIIKKIQFHELLDEDEENKRLQEMSGKSFIVEGWCVRFYELFLKYKKEIVQLFAFDKRTEDKITEYIKTTSAANSTCIGIHVRRGDYRTWNGGRYFFSDDVYISYIRSFLQQHPNTHATVYICSNDPALNKDYYRQQLTDIKVYFPQGNPAEDLCLMSRCNYLIGAPSTFSLVASMYNNIPLCWMENDNAADMRFKYFDYLFKHIR